MEEEHSEELNRLKKINNNSLSNDKKELLDKRIENLTDTKSYEQELSKYGKVSSIYLESINTFFDKQGTLFIPKIDYLKINEAKENAYVSRFSLKGVDLFRELPINEPVKFTVERMIKAIEYGMIILINYKGKEDDVLSGHERVIYPMVIGKSSKNKLLLRSWHLRGWSVSNNKNTEKIWRMFRPDRILSMTFTGSFFRLPPSGYNMYDKGMKGGIIIAADFSQIRKNQTKLIDSQQIQSREDANISKMGLTQIELVNTNTTLDITDPFKNKYLNVKELDFMTVTFMDSILGGDKIAVLGLTSDKPNLTVKAFDEKKKAIGTYKTISTLSGRQLKSFKAKVVKGQSEFDLYIFTKKI